MTAAIRAFAESDVAFAFDLADYFGWATAHRWFSLLAAHDPDGCFVAETPRGRGGLVTTTRYTRSAWIGNLMVSPRTGQLGLGTRLFEHALAHLSSRGVETVALDADRPGVRIYERHGFVRQFASRRFHLRPVSGEPPRRAVRLQPSEWPALSELDRNAFGDDRARLLRLLLQVAEAAWVVPDGGGIAGYGLVIATSRGARLGPWVARDVEAAEDLLSAAIGVCQGRTLGVAVPEPNAHGIDLLRRRGFEESAPCLRMTLGPDPCLGASERIFGLASAAVG